MSEPTLVERLRAHAAHLYALTSDSGEADDEMAAAALIEALTAQRRVLREACDSALNSGVLRFGQDALSMSIRAKLYSALAATEDKP
jgi:hypothetical protein